MPETYIKEVRPPSVKGNPVLVEFSVFVIDINSINVEDMDFRVDMFVHQKWTEPRLTLSDDLFEEGDDFVTLPPEFFEYLWQPDPYFLNSKVSGECKKRNMRIDRRKVTIIASFKSIHCAIYFRVLIFMWRRENLIVFTFQFLSFCESVSGAILI